MYNEVMIVEYWGDFEINGTFPSSWEAWLMSPGPQKLNAYQNQAKVLSFKSLSLNMKNVSHRSQTARHRRILLEGAADKVSRGVEQEGCLGVGYTEGHLVAKALPERWDGMGWSV